MPDEDLLLDVAHPEFGAGVVGVCDICHRRQAVIVLNKERYKICVLDYLNKSWLRTQEKPGAFTMPFTSSSEFVATEAVPGGVAISIHLRSSKAVKRPLVTIVPDVLGITEATLEAGIRFARAGYDAVIPDVGRTPGIGLMDIGFKRGMHLVLGTVPISTFHRERLFRVLDACRAKGLEDPMVDPKRQAVFGVGHGGALALAYAAETPGLSAVVLAYPQCPSPVGRLRALSTPVLLVGGGLDKSSGHGFALVEDVLERAGVPLEIRVIPNGRTNFLSRESPEYRVRPAEAGWKQMLEFMKAKLEPPPPPPPKPTPPPATKPTAPPGTSAPAAPVATTPAASPEAPKSLPPTSPAPAKTDPPSPQ